jgi:hypothetical protein
VKPGEVVRGEFDITLPAGRHNELVTHFRIVASTIPDHENEVIPMTFLAPGEKP